MNQNSVHKSVYNIVATCLLTICSQAIFAQADTSLKNTLPTSGKTINNKPVGKGWVNLLLSLNDWNAEKEYWKLKGGVLHGEANGENVHHYAWTKKNLHRF